MMENLANETGPLTVVVTWPVRKGREKEFEAWRHEIAAAALKFPGHMGVNVIRPSGAEPGVCGDFPIRYVRAPACLAGVGHPSGAAKKGRTIQGDSTIIPSRERSGVLVFATGSTYIPSALENGSGHRRGCLAGQYAGFVVADSSYTWTTFSLARTPDIGRHSYSAHVGDYAVTGKDSETLAVIAYEGGQ